MTTRLIQLAKDGVRRVALVEEPYLRLVTGCSSIYSLAQEAIAAEVKLSVLARQRATDNLLEYDPVYQGKSHWKILPPIDHPHESARCLISGTGLTHLGSARDRQQMHSAINADLTDSMKMFRWGVEGGKPQPGQVGTAPEWFYKGTGDFLRAHGEPLDVPAYAEDGGEEAEIAAIYLIDSNRRPRRIGMAAGNEFSDHQFEKKNYLNLASSKLRMCSLGPEFVTDAPFESVPGEVTIERSGKVLWAKKLRTGEAEMCHSLKNIEHHHFKFETHRRPGDLHIHYLGANCLSFGDNIKLVDGDVMQISFEGYGRTLLNPLHAARVASTLVEVIPQG